MASDPVTLARRRTVRTVRPTGVINKDVKTLQTRLGVDVRKRMADSCASPKRGRNIDIIDGSSAGVEQSYSTRALFKPGLSHLGQLVCEGILRHWVAWLLTPCKEQAGRQAGRQVPPTKPPSLFSGQACLIRCIAAGISTLQKILSCLSCLENTHHDRIQEIANAKAQSCLSRACACQQQLVYLAETSRNSQPGLVRAHSYSVSVLRTTDNTPDSVAMTSVERPNRNSLTAYGHLFEPRPSHVRRNTLRKKRASSDVSLVRLSAHDLDEAAELTASEVSALDLAGTPSLHHANDSQSPFAAEEQTQHRYGNNVLPWGWMPTRVSEKKPTATVTMTEVAVGGPLESRQRERERESELEPAKVPAQVQ